MATQIEKTVSATEFKAKCLDLMEQVASGRVRRIHITKRGKPFVAIEPDGAIPSLKPWAGESIFGCMKGWPSPVPEGHDWEKPMFSDAELDGFIDAEAHNLAELTERKRA